MGRRVSRGLTALIACVAAGGLPFVLATPAVGEVAGPLLEAIKERIPKVKVGDGRGPESEMGPLVTSEHRDKVAADVLARALMRRLGVGPLDYRRRFGAIWNSVQAGEAHVDA